MLWISITNRFFLWLNINVAFADWPDSRSNYSSLLPILAFLPWWIGVRLLCFFLFTLMEKFNFICCASLCAHRDVGGKKLAAEKCLTSIISIFGWTFYDLFSTHFLVPISFSQKKWWFMTSICASSFFSGARVCSVKSSIMWITEILL